MKTATILSATAALLLCVGCQSSSFRSAFRPEFTPANGQIALSNPLPRNQTSSTAYGSSNGGQFSQYTRSTGRPSVIQQSAATELNDTAARNLDSGNLASAQGRLAEAKRHYQAVIREQPLHPMANHRLAVIADTEQDYRTAEKHYLIAFNVQPTNVDLLSDLGYSYLLQGRFVESQRYLNDALYHNPSHVKALNNLGLLYSKQNKSNEALTAFLRAGTKAQAQDKMEQLFPQGPPTAGSSIGSPSKPLVSRSDIVPGFRPMVYASESPRPSDTFLPMGAGSSVGMTAHAVPSMHGQGTIGTWPHHSNSNGNQTNLNPTASPASSLNQIVQSTGGGFPQQHPAFDLPQTNSPQQRKAGDHLGRYRSMKVPDHRINRSLAEIDAQSESAVSGSMRPSMSTGATVVPRSGYPPHRLGPRDVETLAAPPGNQLVPSAPGSLLQLTPSAQPGFPAHYELPADPANADPLDSMPTWPHSSNNSVPVAPQSSYPSPKNNNGGSRTVLWYGNTQSPSVTSPTSSRIAARRMNSAQGRGVVHASAQQPAIAPNHVQQADNRAQNPYNLRGSDPYSPTMDDSIRAAAISGMNAGRGPFFNMSARQPATSSQVPINTIKPQTPSQNSGSPFQPTMRPGQSWPIGWSGESQSGLDRMGLTQGASVTELEAMHRRTLEEINRINILLEQERRLPQPLLRSSLMENPR